MTPRSPHSTPGWRRLLGGLWLVVAALAIGGLGAPGPAEAASGSSSDAVQGLETPSPELDGAIALRSLFEAEDEDDEEPEQDTDAASCELRWAPPALMARGTARRPEPATNRTTAGRRVRGPPVA